MKDLKVVTFKEIKKGNPFLLEGFRFLKVTDNKVLGTHGFYELEPNEKVCLITKDFTYHKI